MASEHEATWLLASLRDALRAGQPLDSVWLAGAMRALAEVRHELAISFFLDCLDASDHRWRIEALTCLGFHYVLRPDHPALDRVRALLLADPEETARLTAAAALGSHLSQSAVRQAEWPDAALARALEHDPSPHVRAAAANALLAQAGVPRAAILRRMRDLTGASASLTLAAIAALARAEALDDAAH